MYRSNPCLQGLDSGSLEPLRPFYRLRTSTGGLIIVKTLKNKHSGPFLTHIQAVNSWQNIPDIAPDSGSQMIRNDLETPPEHCSKSRDETHGFRNVYVDFSEFHICFFTHTNGDKSNSADQKHSISNCSQDRKSRLS